MRRDIRSWLRNADCGSMMRLTLQTVETLQKHWLHHATGKKNKDHLLRLTHQQHFSPKPHFTYLVMAEPFPQKVKREAIGNNHNHKTSTKKCSWWVLAPSLFMAWRNNRINQRYWNKGVWSLDFSHENTSLLTCFMNKLLLEKSLQLWKQLH